MAEPRTIQVGISGTSSVESYTLAPGLAQFVESVYVEIDNAAGADAQPVLTWQDQSQVTIGKRPAGGLIDGGTQGSSTWARGLTDTGAVATAGAWVLLETVTLAAPGQIAFTTIPQTTFQHLRLVGQVRGVNGNQLGLQFNASAGGAYNSTWVTGEADAFGTAVLDGSNLGGDEMYWQYTASSGALGDTDTDSFSRFTIDIPFYRTDTKKDAIVEMATRVQNAWYAVHGIGQWEDTAAITRVDVYEAQVTSALFRARSTISLYGGR